MDSNENPENTFVAVEDEEQLQEDSALIKQSDEGSRKVSDEDEEQVIGTAKSEPVGQSDNASPDIIDTSDENVDSVRPSKGAMNHFSAPKDGAGDHEPVRHRQTSSSSDYTRNTFEANLHFNDHYTLDNMSSQLSFRDHKAIVMVNNLEQITLEKKNNDDHIVTKRTIIGSPGLLVLRMVSTWIAFMIAVFILVFCFNNVLFLFLGLVARTGLTSSNGFNFFGFFACVLSFPVFIIGLAQIMVFAQTFVMDAWQGSKFFIAVSRIDSVTIDWVSFTAFIGLPIFTASILLMIGIAEWWNITLFVWMCSVLVLYIVFMVALIYHEVKACLNLVRSHPKLRNPDFDTIGERLSLVDTWYHLCHLRLKQKLSGYEYVEFLSHGCESYPEKLSYDEMKGKESFKSFVGPFSRFTKLGFMRTIFNKLDEPIRQHGVSEITGQITYVTKSSWGLESIFCRNRNAQFVALIHGESALTNKQVKSSLWCFRIGIFLIALAFFSVLMWLARHSLSIPLSVLVAILFFVVNTAIFYKTVRSVWDAALEYKTFVEDGSRRSLSSTSNTTRHVHECFRVTEPKRMRYESIVMVFIAVFFYFMPLVGLFVSGNLAVAVFFVFLGFLAFIRDVCSVSACLSELGTLEEVTVNETQQQHAQWKEKQKLSKMLRETSLDKRRLFWIATFFILMLFICNIYALTSVFGVTHYVSEGFQFANGNEFLYKASEFTSCALPSIYKSPEKEESTLVDLVFLADIAAYETNVSNEMIDQWFESDVSNLSDQVDKFKKAYAEEHAGSAATYALIDFPRTDMKIISVLGTKNAWDILHDAQIWMPVILFQVVLSVIPFGRFFSPFLPYMIQAVSHIEGRALKDISYYKEISTFVESLKEEGLNMMIVGHSLGGGTAMISGTQTKVPSLGLSGINIINTRRTFDPPLSIDDINKFTFNIKPDKDPVPLIDKLPRNFKRINCRADQNDWENFCHLPESSLCEVLYTCGSFNRPIPCECVYRFGYEKPESVNGLDFADACNQ